jgi:hypothetical protein
MRVLRGPHDEGVPEEEGSDPVEIFLQGRVEPAVDVVEQTAFSILARAIV